MDGEGDTHGDHHGAQHVLASIGRPRSVEVINGVERRRRWGLEEKSRIVAESRHPGANISEVARRNGVSVGLLHHWRRAARVRVEDERQRFVPLLPIGSDENPSGAATSVVEIEMASGRVRVIGAVDPSTLRAVIASMRGG